MSELVSKYPTAGGIYWWASKLGGPVWGWFTGWFNFVGLVGVVASVDYACATFLNALFGYFEVDFIINFADDQHILGETFVLFALILLLGRADQHLHHPPAGAREQHLGGLARARRGGDHRDPGASCPTSTPSADFVFTERHQQLRLQRRQPAGGMYWFYVLPLGFLLTQYTITGFDASAHISEETHGASVRPPRACGSRSSTRR